MIFGYHDSTAPRQTETSFTSWQRVEDALDSTEIEGAKVRPEASDPMGRWGWWGEDVGGNFYGENFQMAMNYPMLLVYELGYSIELLKMFSRKK